MALTGGRISASIYGIDKADSSAYGLGGRNYNFPNVGVLIYDIPTAGSESYTSPAGVVCNAVIEVLPTGTRNSGRKYYSNQSAAAIATAGS